MGLKDASPKSQTQKPPGKNEFLKKAVSNNQKPTAKQRKATINTLSYAQIFDAPRARENQEYALAKNR
jgi:hypothetical protein